MPSTRQYRVLYGTRTNQYGQTMADDLRVSENHALALMRTGGFNVQTRICTEWEPVERPLEGGDPLDNDSAPSNVNE